MADPERLAAFRERAEAMFDDDPERVEPLMQMERIFLDSQFSTDPDQDFQLLLGLFSDKPIKDVMTWLSLRPIETGGPAIESPSKPLGQTSAPSEAIATPIIPPLRNEGLALERTIHNERVKLNANFCNSLAVWFAGAGSAGALINTMIASGAHNLAGAGEIGAAGIVLALVLKWLANREIEKLR